MKRNMILGFLVFLLALTSFFSSYLPSVKAAYVEITSMLPDTHRAEVGNRVLIIGKTNTTDGLCTVWFDHLLVNETNAIGNAVNITFRVPSFPQGNHTITLRDETTENNATTGLYITPSYYIAAELPEKPKQLQQNDSVTLNLTIAGGTASTNYDVNATVGLPFPLNETAYSAIVKITTDEKGTGSTRIRYPNDTFFNPSGSNTNYTGQYSAFFDKIRDRARTSFFVGLTDASEYHRVDLIELIALGYVANKTANITMTSLETNKTLRSIEVNVTQHGIINATWMVPSNASIGNYNITVFVENSTKKIKDSQIIRLPGYPTKFYTQNLAGDSVPQILVEAIDKATNKTYSNTTKTNAMTSLSLEKGDHTLEAYWKKVRVNQTEVTITEPRTYDLTCNLTNMKITVEDETGNHLPFVTLDINYQYTTTKEETRENGSSTGKTGVSGAFHLNSTLPHINYSIYASRYGKIFNKNNDTVEHLPAEEQINVTIICPTKTVTLNITDHHRNPISNAQIRMTEHLGGISYSEITSLQGLASINCTFGKYSVAVYKDGVFLNETITDLFNDTNSEVYCKLYNLTISVKILDYFGQQIPAVNVTMQRDGLQYLPSTKSDGSVKFLNIIGGNLQFEVYLDINVQPSVVKSFYIDKPSLIHIKISKYVLIAGLLVETGQLATLSIIVLATLLVISLEVYRRRHPKLQKS